MDDLTRDFMNLVACAAWEVQTADPARLALDATAEADASVRRQQEAKAKRKPTRSER
jgi:hypothetical protein